MSYDHDHDQAEGKPTYDLTITLKSGQTITLWVREFTVTHTGPDIERFQWTSVKPEQHLVHLDLREVVSIMSVRRRWWRK